MFIFFRDPIRPNKPEPLDPVQAEPERRILFAPPGHLGPFPTYEKVRAELARLDGRGAVSARALTLAEAGFGPGVRVVVVRDVDGGIDRVVPVEAGLQPPSEGAQAESFRPLVEAHPEAENAEFGIKEITWAREPSFVEKTETYPDLAGEEASNSPSLVTGPLKPTTPSARKRRHKDDVPWHEKHFFEGHKVSKTLSKWEREWIDGAVLRWKVLKGKTEQIVCLTIKPSHLDDLGPVERMEYWEPLVNRVRSYRNSRCTVLGKPRSSWEVRAVGVRESNQDHLGEHCHTAFSFPNREEADLFIAHVQDPANSDVWGDDVHAMRISTREEMVGGKLSSFFNYMLKAAHPRSRFADHTIGWQASGALVGKRYFITENLTSPEVIARTEAGVARLKEIREEKKLAVCRKRARERARQEGLYSYSAAPAPESIAPEPTMAFEPGLIEPDTCLTPVSAAHIHRESERRDMDLVEIETRPALPAVIEPAPVSRESESVDAAPAAITAAPILAEIPAPAFVPDIVVGPAAFITPIQAFDAMAKFSPVSSGRGFAFRSAAAAVRRSISRGTRAAAGWISSRLFESPGFVAAGAFLGAPDVQPDPW